ncbi:MAG: enoyl-CoA hydratase/isomerase family protein [Candidatus Marinimicrobia bacterium]|nr:enoyl-CoA hydratase/isomerase family protein [Candidatus Neomarinimicrobiota bacterium]
MKNNLIDVELIEDNIYVLSFNNSPVNAISIQFLREFNSSINLIIKNHNARCLIISSKLKHFCAGADLKERSQFTHQETIHFLDNLNNVFNKIDNMNIPVIASLDGAVLGGGAELALCCDFRIASQHIKIGFPETGLGIIPGAGGTYRLPKIIGLSNAKRYIYTANIINSQKALEIGLIDEISINPLDNSIRLAREIKKNAPIAINSAKKSINNSFRLNLKKGLEVERNAYLETLGTKDRQEALKAFNEKRKPIWRNE